MLTVVEAKEVNGVIESSYGVKQVCAACGYDLDEQELSADTCRDCGAPLKLAQHTWIYATSIPAAQGSTLV